MKTITMPMFNRPQYLVRVIEALKANQIEGYTLYAGIEPGCDEVLRIARSIDFIPTRVCVNSSVLGVRINPFDTISRAMRDGSQFNVNLEDDVVLSPDAFDLVEWFRTLPDIDDYVSLCLMRYDSSVDKPLEVSRGDTFTPLGLCFSAPAWEKHFVSNWHTDPRGWDFSIQEYIRNHDLRTLHPCLARSTHIGREGVHMSPEHNDAIFSNLPISDGSHRCDFIIREWPEKSRWKGRPSQS